MHNSLPRQTLDDVPSKFFGHINEIYKDFLMPHILTAIQNQMKHSFFYDAYLMDRNIIQQVNIIRLQLGRNVCIGLIRVWIRIWIRIWIRVRIRVR
ncbi:unnamed protein product [Rhizophagus irregularis]|nr:unnamed protein product [Rhizophagus irregularis]